MPCVFNIDMRAPAVEVEVEGGGKWWWWWWGGVHNKLSPFHGQYCHLLVMH